MEATDSRDINRRIKLLVLQAPRTCDGWSRKWIGLGTMTIGIFIFASKAHLVRPEPPYSLILA